MSGIGFSWSVQDLIPWLSEKIYCWDTFQESDLVERLQMVIDLDLRGGVCRLREVLLSPLLVGEVLPAV